MEYTDFLRSKRVAATSSGFDISPEQINPQLFIWQREVVRWGLRRGRAALFEDTGLGKTIQQLEWARQVVEHTGGNVLILAPLVVNYQTADEAREKLGVEITLCRSQADVRAGVNIANYEMLKHFDAASFTGVVLDEGSLLKSYSGKIKNALMAAFHATPYKLVCTATPAPNDYMEIGNYAEFLGVMPSSEMLMRWFINDTMAMGKYRLKGHAERDFWAWVASWAVSLRRPSDIGYSDEGYNLPPLTIRHETVEVDLTIDALEGQLFRTPTLNATTMHQEMRRTAAARAERVAEIVTSNAGASDIWAVWCNTNYEADALMARIPDAVEVRGSDSVKRKEDRLRAFTRGGIRVLLTKPEIAGFGLNWQHCHQTAFVGLSYSYEQFYQAVRRFYRFGQRNPVEVAVVAAETEGAVLATIQRKMAEHERMQDAMVAASRTLLAHEDLRLATYDPHTPMSIPTWLMSQSYRQQQQKEAVCA